MIVRLAKHDDIEAIIALGTRLIARGAFSHTHVSIRACTNRLLLAIRNQHEWIGVAEHAGAIVGFLILVAVPYWWSDSERYVLDDGLYAERPGAGAALIRAGAAWAHSLHGAKELIVALNSQIETDRAARLLNHCGFAYRGLCVSLKIAEGVEQWAA